MAVFSDNVYDADGQPVAKTIRAHDVTTKALIDETTSSGVDGSFILTGTAGDFLLVIMDSVNGHLVSREAFA